jgi:hypothetical protein
MLKVLKIFKQIEQSEKEAFAAAPGCSSFAVLFLALSE